MTYKLKISALIVQNILEYDSRKCIKRKTTSKMHRTEYCKKDT